MSKLIFTWIDLQNRYRVTSPAYDDLAKQFGFDQEESLNWVWDKLVRVGGYGIKHDHPFHLVEDMHQRERLLDCCGTYFRYGVFPKLDREGRCKKDGTIIYTRDARDGAWEMGDDGRPVVNLPKARIVQGDVARKRRNVELIKTDEAFRRAWEAWYLQESPEAKVVMDGVIQSSQALRDMPVDFAYLLEPMETPAEIRAAWPAGLPR